jgi:RNA polymerase sigma factor (sigma-70 family)
LKNSTIDKNRFSEFYSEYKGKIYNLAYRMTGDRTAAEDITQEAFIIVYQKFSTFRGESNIYTWIYSIAKNICLQHLRKVKSGKFQSIENLINTFGSEDSKTDYSAEEKQLYINQVKEGCLLGLLRCLSFYQRISFILSILNELSVNEISKITGKSPNSTRILIYRAKQNIKNFLCKNCSLYDSANKCKCENLISFCIKQNWISCQPNYNDAGIIESELSHLKREVSLYKTLTEYQAPEETTKRISDYIKHQKFRIFSVKKVK